jgi:nucleotide-binding universal stress UspA family protein
MTTARILVPLDGSPAAQAIVPFILEVAGPLNMAVRLLRVVEPISSMVVKGVVLVDDLAARVRDAEEYLAGIAAELREHGVDVEWEVRRGVAALVILDAAKSFDIDLIAMSTQGQNGFGVDRFGSVTEQTLRHAEVPVVLSRPIVCATDVLAPRRWLPPRSWKSPGGAAQSSPSMAPCLDAS